MRFQIIKLIELISIKGVIYFFMDVPVLLPDWSPVIFLRCFNYFRSDRIKMYVKWKLFRIFYKVNYLAWPDPRAPYVARKKVGFPFINVDTSLLYIVKLLYSCITN